MSLPNPMRLAGCLAFLLAPAAASGAQASPPAPPDFTAIDRHAERLLRAARVPGAAIAIVHEGRIVHARGFGRDATGRPVSPQTAFVLGSMSKSITALAVMQLVEQGRVDLDAPVRRYLPSFRVASSDAGAAITVRQLLLHTSGLPPKAGRQDGVRASLADHVRALQDVTPDAPGTHRYASANYLVLGALVEQVTGESFAAYTERAIFTPLAMRHSFTRRDRALDAGFAGGHVSLLGFPLRSSLPEEHDRLPTAGLMSSAEDLAQFLTMQLARGQFRGVSLLGDSLVRRMHTGAAPSDGFSYAFGWRDGTIGGVRALHHGGIVPDFAGRMIMLPDAGWGVVVLTNLSSAIPWPVVPTSHQLAHDIAANLAGVPLPNDTPRHRTVFVLIGVAMALITAAQLRTLWRVSRAARRAPWRQHAPDLLFLVALVLLPRLVGLDWATFVRGAPDVGWWLVLLALLTCATVGLRLLIPRSGKPRLAGT